ncbi:MAG TPA: hypothetical protein VHC49_18065 [Mycobacteriales bacterium]|nr:hypothetical protein [Mycobacteriales bacterium]
MSEWAIFLNGTYGVGKSTVLNHVGDLLARADQPFSLMDVDWYHRSWPPADPVLGNSLIEAKNMAASWANYRSVGPRQLVISGVIRERDELDRYGSALGLRIRPVRLVASMETTERRLQNRYGTRQEWKTEWHLTRLQRLREKLDESDLDEAVIDTDDRHPHEVAADVLTHFGYPVKV